ncbi:E3 ubiquitin/ISG15 ligase TRIM25-like [Bombina bombina]|uniref:E3 ubiquitin/ISG15 ligase TRIM25-like n=1 Tax=Bombina bombina TaxID=8345 RepID=UPI00235B2C57|nr:E3 ubiquitin/ISG15 ligase TRIM25-like [Bombina bombina]
MASADMRKELTCPICVSIYTDPVTLTCGHNFCLSCINRTWDNQDEGEYSCPECQLRFSKRPELKRNLRMHNISKTFQLTGPVNDTGIFCTYCIHSPVPATKSCLMRDASLCDAHLSVHSKSGEHVLTEPTTSWGITKCAKHKKLLKYYCTEDAACICESCKLSGEHRGHDVELLNEASEKKKEKLKAVLQKLTTKIEKTENRVQSLQEHRRRVQEKAAGGTERLTTQIRDIMEQLKDLEKRVLSEITRQQDQALTTISKVIQQLEKEKDKLTRKMCHIEDLDDFCGAEKGDNEVTQRGDKQVPAGGDLDEVLISVTLYRGLADIVTDVKRGMYMHVPSDILLDIKTAHNNIILSGDLKTASYTDINQPRLEKAKRFTVYPQVLSTKSFSSGRHYWEVQISESGDLYIGVCYTSMEREGYQSLIGNNNKSWGLRSFNNNKDLSVRYNTKVTSLSPPLSCDRVGILLDYEAGRLTFYELCDPIRHLHTFTTTFSELLYPAFSAWSDCAWVRILR